MDLTTNTSSGGFHDLIMRKSSLAADTFSAGRKRKLTIQRGDGLREDTFEKQLEEENHFKVVIDGDEGGVMMRKEVVRIAKAINLRSAYHVEEDLKKVINSKVRRPVLTDGVYQLPDPEHQIRSWADYAKDVQSLLYTVESTTSRKACEHRLGIIQERSRMFFLLNTDIEDCIGGCQRGGGVFSNVTKVDNSVQLSRLMNAQELLDFILEYHQRHPHDVIGKDADGSNITLQEVFDDYGVLNPKELTVDGLDWHPRWMGTDINTTTGGPSSPTTTTNASSSPKGSKKPKPPLGKVLKKYFLSFQGLPFPSVIKKVLKRNDDRSKYIQATEFRIPVHGSSRDELTNIAKFFKQNEVGPFKRNKWVLHFKFVDRVKKDDHMGSGEPYANCRTLQDQIDNMFGPLFDATLRSDEHAALHWFLPQVGAIHIEAFRPTSEDFDKDAPPPNEIPFNAAESHLEDEQLRYRDIAAQIETHIERRRSANHMSELYYDYYVWANLVTLNKLRARAGLDAIQLRRGGGEGNLQNLLAGYLLADMVTHCSKMADHPVLQYLYGYHRIGVSLSPLFDNQQHTPYAKNPLLSFLHRSLRVSISTEEPLSLHTSYDPLLEEYGSAQKLCRLSPLDMTELARNSVLMSTFSRERKEEWLGPRYDKGVRGNVVKKSQVSNARLEFRSEVWKQEKELLAEIQRQQAAARNAMELESGGQNAQQSWASNLSSVKDVEYFAVLDSRIRFPRTVICGPQFRDKSTMAATPLVARAVQMRKKYIWEAPKPWHQRQGIVEEAFQSRTDTFDEDDWCYVPQDSIFVAYRKRDTKAWPKHIATLEQFKADMTELKSICDSIEVKDFAHRRLELLESKFRLHLALNHANEAGSTDLKASSNRDLYHSFKVDTHVHMAAGMTARDLRDFMIEKMASHSDDIVMEDKTGQILTLENMMKKYNISRDTLTTDQLNVHADHTLFQRFDNFNNKYNPMAIADLRTLLLKTENYMNGRYFAEMIQNTFSTYTKDRFTFAENRLSIYGSKQEEWTNLANWFATHGMASNHNKWIIQVPRVTYTVFRKMGAIGSFGQYLANIFQPLWEASLHPGKHPRLHHFLNHVAGFDSVDNEATLDPPFQAISPSDWTSTDNPPYGYHIYHLWANIRTLNEFRAYRGFPPLTLRPHCGESGADDHLLYTYLCADAINHGVNLRNDPSAQYLYYVSQIGLAVSPLSNNALFMYFLHNPFPDFFRRGLNVSLSTDDPLMFHQTVEPLIEEYSIAAKVWGFSPNDMCEIARNSVLQSGFDPAWKKNAIGERYYMSSSLGNDPMKTHLSDIRVAFRFETYHTEVAYLSAVAGIKLPRNMYTAEEEQEVVELQLAKQQETVLLSTHDQEMEVISRELDLGKEQLKKAKLQLENLRKQNRSLVELISDYGLKLEREKAEKEEEALRRKKAPVKYVRTSKAELAAQLLKATDEDFKKVVQWQPKPPPTSGQSARASTADPLRLARTTQRPLPRPGTASAPGGKDERGVQITKPDAVPEV